MKHLIVIGVGGFPRELYNHAKNSIGYGVDWDFKGYLDGDKKASADEYEKLPKPVLGDVFTYEIKKDDVFICAVGAPHIRKRLIETVEERGGEFISVIHKTAIVHENARIGKGCILCPYTVVMSCAIIEDHVTLQVYAGVGHDSHVGKYTSIMGNVSITGNVNIGDLVYMGDSSNTLPHARIGDGAFVGASSLVLRRVKSGDKVFGVPALSILATPPLLRDCNKNSTVACLLEERRRAA